MSLIDTTHCVETPEGIALVLRPAGLVARVLAYLVDLAIRFAIFSVVSIVATITGKLGWGLLALVWFALEWLYPVMCELLWHGATPGKRTLGLRVVMDSGLPLTPAASVTRNLLRVADYLPMSYGLGLLFMLWRADSKRLGDLAAGTLVVFVDAVMLDSALPATPFAPQPPCQSLGLQGQTAVIAWAGRLARLTPERAEELARLALPVLPLGAQPGRSIATASDTRDAAAAPQLLAVAHWLQGQRQNHSDTATPQESVH